MQSCTTLVQDIVLVCSIVVRKERRYPISSDDHLKMDSNAFSDEMNLLMP